MLDKAYVMIDEDDHDEPLSYESEKDEAKYSKEGEEAEISLNAMPRVQKLTFMNVMAWIVKFEVTILVDSYSTHNSSILILLLKLD